MHLSTIYSHFSPENLWSFQKLLQESIYVDTSYAAPVYQVNTHTFTIHMSKNRSKWKTLIIWNKLFIYIYLWANLIWRVRRKNKMCAIHGINLLDTVIITTTIPRYTTFYQYSSYFYFYTILRKWMKIYGYKKGLLP